MQNPWAPGRALGVASSLALLSCLPPTPLAAQRPSLELRGGIAFSSALVEDAVVDPEVLDRLLGGTDNPERLVGPLVLRPAPAPVLVLAASLPVSPTLAVEGEGGWTFARLRAENPLRAWDTEDLGVGHAVIGLRLTVRESYYLRGGLGAIRYAADEGLFRSGSETAGVAQAGLGVTRRFDRLRVSVDLSGQAHGFATPTLREAGGEHGSVYRGMLQVGVAFGAGDP